ncbi:MAG: formyltetrahydrofolate deformylase [Dehalococcoidia bacterium]|nr:formyltetrahydrofolate deformylase [Chloroflexota bacterium]MXW24885.1 formyltetrahydrofolate deformylase [Dehalococcoidia bacterium]MXY88394.1 formyltetrahydrofolate deformylase [Dehalococcoidia bacterium]MYA52744.1 formyltetrahydrofolate deformylase [Dehalococcoidia bacterium]
MSDSSGEGTTRLRVQCPDRPGVVSAVFDYLYRHGANILQADQHSTSGEHPRFFLRVEYDLVNGNVPAAEVATGFGDEVAGRFDMEWSVSYSSDRPRIAILGTREPNCVLDLLWRARTGELPAEIVMVLSNREILRPLADRFDVPFECLPVTRETKVEQEKQMLERLRGRVDLVVLARYMQILTPTFLDEFPRRVINIHHSFLPAFAGADPYGQAEERGVKIIGATAHYATEDLDAGPIIEQDVLRVTHRDNRAELMRLGRELERVVLARAVRWHVEDRVLVYGNKTVVFQ